MELKKSTDTATASFVPIGHPSAFVNANAAFWSVGQRSVPAANVSANIAFPGTGSVPLGFRSVVTNIHSAVPSVISLRQSAPIVMTQRAAGVAMPNLAIPFPQPQLCFVPPNFHWPPVMPTSQPIVLESGPELYRNETASEGKESVEKVDLDSRGSKGRDASGSEAAADKKRTKKANKSSSTPSEKMTKRFLRCGGGQVWEDRSLAEWDPNDFRMFCGDLGNEVSDELLAKAFRKYPSFQKAKVVRDIKTNKSKGYGFVSFKHQDDLIRACREMDGKYVGNRPIKLRKSKWKERSIEAVRKKQKQKQLLGLA